MTGRFTDTGKEELSIRFFLFSEEENVSCNGHLICPSVDTRYTFPAGIIRLQAYGRGNFVSAHMDQSAFFSPGWSGTFIIKNGKAEGVADENLTVLPEKGYFRVLNLLKEPVSVRRTGGTEIFTDVDTLTPYRLAGAGRYRLQFFKGKEKIGEREVSIKEGSHGTVFLKDDEIGYIEEFSI